MAKAKTQRPLEIKRVTFLIPSVLDENIEKVAAFAGLKKMDFATKALAGHLESMGVTHPFQPMAAPWKESASSTASNAPTPAARSRGVARASRNF